MFIPDLPESTDWYVNHNKGFMTASKLKALRDCPWSYYIQYELGLALPEEKDDTHFRIGNSIDDFVSYGREKWNEKYAVLDEGETKPVGGEATQELLDMTMHEITELQAAIDVARAKNRGTKTNEEKLWKANQRYDFLQKHLGKKLFTNAEGQPIVRIAKEIERQPTFEHLNPRFECQKMIECEFEGVALRGTLDRIDVKNLEIRDTKTIKGEVPKKFERHCFFAIRDMGYDFSMAFYEALANSHKEADWKVLLEFFGKGSDPLYLQVEVPRDILEEQKAEIFGIDGEGGLIRFYNECKKHNYFPTHAELNGFEDAHLRCPFYTINPGAIQKRPVYFQDPTY